VILSRVSEYLRRHKRASVVDLAHGLDASPDALKGMLSALELKGRVRRLPAGTSCSGCCKCDPNEVELYEWTGD
jgi:Mn-dependent DtxR family transcriptional regulator